MEFVREIIDSNVLEQVIPLPRSFHDRKVEIFVFPARSQKQKITINNHTLDKMMEGSITQSLIGAVPISHDITLDEIRSLRLSKYDSAD